MTPHLRNTTHYSTEYMVGRVAGIMRVFAMKIVDQRFHGRLTKLEAGQRGTNGIAELALDNRKDGFGLPALTEETIEAGSIDQITAGLALRPGLKPG